MKLTHCGFTRRWTLALGGLLFVAAPGCERQPVIDRAAYVADDEVDEDEAPDESTGEKPERRRSNRKLGIASSIERTSPPTADFRAVQATGVRPLSQPIATPLPAQIISTAEAEHASRPAAYVGRSAGPAGPAAPQLTTTLTPALDVSAAVRQADERNRRGAASAAKGAWFTARVEFNDALTQLAASFDAREGGARRSTALAAGITALTEAEAFTGRGAQSLANTSALLSAHSTAPFVGPFAPGTSPSALHEAYVRFAVERLSESVVGCEAGSVALHGLGKVHNAAGTTIVDGRSKARAFYEAALAVGPGNFLAANDLAVLLADEGRLEQARDLLHGALRRSPQPAMWNNLAVVNDRLGRTDLAQLARQESAALERRGATAPGTVLPTHNVAWLDPRSFAATSRTGAELAPPTPQSTAAAMKPNTTPTATSAAKPAAVVGQRPANRALAY